MWHLQINLVYYYLDVSLYLKIKITIYEGPKSLKQFRFGAMLGQRSQKLWVPKALAISPSPQPQNASDLALPPSQKRYRFGGWGSLKHWISKTRSHRHLDEALHSTAVEYP